MLVPSNWGRSNARAPVGRGTLPMCRAFRPRHETQGTISPRAHLRDTGQIEENAMAPKTKAGKRRKVARVMGEFKRGKLKGGRGRRGRVKSRRQAIAIAMSESG